MLAANADLRARLSQPAWPASPARCRPARRRRPGRGQALGMPCYETPTGWKFFGNLLDAGTHHAVRRGELRHRLATTCARRTALWAVLFWLNILAARRQSVARDRARALGALTGATTTPATTTRRSTATPPTALIDALRAKPPTLPGQRLGAVHASARPTISRYTDPVDGSVSDKQGMRIGFEDGSRIVYRLSGHRHRGRDKVLESCVLCRQVNLSNT
ncbi:MAG: hypothetical protein MZV65_41260 [Chromatiales bacterium]|nr:hypothetical protein [Chromatiales bacterium]